MASCPRLQSRFVSFGDRKSYTGHGPCLYLRPSTNLRKISGVIDYPREHRRRIRTNNMIERLNREIRRRTRVVGSFPDGRSALMRVCARYVTSNEWSTRRYLDMSRLGETVREAN